MRSFKAKGLVILKKCSLCFKNYRQLEKKPKYTYSDELKKETNEKKKRERKKNNVEALKG